MRRASLALLSLLAASPAFADEPFVAQFRVTETGRTSEAAATRRGADIFVDAQTLSELGLAAPAGPAPYRLQDIDGAVIATDEGASEVTISCNAACFATTTLNPALRGELPVESATGAFVNTDVNIQAIDGDSDLSAAFDMGAFSPFGLVENNWVAGGHSVRLETRFTIDNVARRTRITIGDALTRGGSGASPVRFGGVQWGTAFALDPNFVTFPTPTLNGEAAAPSVVDLYVGDALRLRSETPAGPFTISDPPIVTGAGVARITVTDALGRQQVISQPFYASPTMLRPRLSDFALAAGLLRENFSVESNDYDGAFISGLYRRGLTSWLTSEVRADAGDGLTTGGGTISIASPFFGQVDLTAARSWRDESDGGALAGVAWSRNAENFSFTAAAEQTSNDFARRGVNRPGTTFQSRAAASWSDGRFGAASVAYARRERADDEDDVETMALSYIPRPIGPVSLAFSVLDVNAERDETTVTLSLAAPFGDDVSGSLWVEQNGDSVQTRARMQRGAPARGGVSYRLSASGGGVERYEGALGLSGPLGEASFEASQLGDLTGMRGRVAFGVARIGGSTYVSRPLHGAFALIDARAPGVTITHDGRDIGRTNLRGHLLATDLRPYEQNRLSIDIDDMPPGADVRGDTVTVRPAQRTGVVAAFPVQLTQGGEVRVVDSDGAPLPRGAVLIRDDSGARLPVGDDGRVFFSAIDGPTRFHRTEGCTLTVSPADLQSGGALICQGSSS